METTKRDGPLWDEIEGRIPPPPIARLLARTIVHVDPERGTAEIAFDAQEGFVNSTGTIQGGMLAAMLDSTMGPALRARVAGDHVTPTLEMKINFLRPARPGRLLGRGRVVHQTGSVAFLTGELCNEAGEVIATATATARIQRKRTGE
jgi:uncharacterized protein (TIGR00369 family)